MNSGKISGTIKMLMLIWFFLFLGAAVGQTVNYVGTGAGTNTLAYSFDGISWTGAGTSIFTSQGFSAAFSASQQQWIAVGQGTNTIANSSNGMTWTGQSSGVFSTKGSAVAFSEFQGLWVAVGQGTNTIASSSDGLTWFGHGTSIFSSFGSGVAYSEPLNRWVAVGSGTNAMAYSPDGISWTGGGVSQMSIGGAVAFSITQGLFSITGAGPLNKFLHSSNGISWTADGNIIYNSGNGITFGQNKWLSVGQSVTHSMAGAPDGATWSGLGKTVLTTTGYAITFNTNLNRWVATGTGTNTVLYSNDGSSWSVPNQVFTTGCYGVGSFYQLPGQTTPPAGITFISSDLNNANLNGTFAVAFNNSIVVSGGLNVTGDILVFGNWTLNQTTLVQVTGTVQMSAHTTINPNSFIQTNSLILSTGSDLLINLAPGFTLSKRSFFSQSTVTVSVANYNILSGSYGSITTSDPCIAATPTYGASSLSCLLSVAPACSSAPGPVIDVVSTGGTTTGPASGGTNTGMIVGVAIGAALGGIIIVGIIVVVTRMLITKHQIVANAHLKQTAVEDLRREASRATPRDSGERPNPAFQQDSM